MRYKPQGVVKAVRCRCSSATNLVIRLPLVQHREVSVSAEAIHDVLAAWDRMGVILGFGDQLSIVNT